MPEDRLGGCFFGYLAPSIKIQLIPYTIIFTLRTIPIILRTRTKGKPRESAVCYRPASDQCFGGI